MRRLVRELRSQWIGALALFIALGGTAYAVGTVTSSDIVDGTVSKVDFGARVVGPNALAEVPNLRLWGEGANQPRYCGEFNDQHFAHSSGNWGSQFLTSTRSRTGIPIAGQYLITAHLLLPRIVGRAGSGGCSENGGFGGGCSGGAGSRSCSRVAINTKIRIVVYSADGGSRVLDTDDIDESGWDMEPDTYGQLRLHAAGVDRLVPGERVALKCSSQFGGACSGVEDTPRMTITWLGN
jgi:hypothetical protein